MSTKIENQKYTTHGIAGGPTEVTHPVQLTEDERSIIIFALGGLAAMAFRDAENKSNKLSDQAINAARKFGVTFAEKI